MNTISIYIVVPKQLSFKHRLNLIHHCNTEIPFSRWWWCDCKDDISFQSFYLSSGANGGLNLQVIAPSTTDYNFPTSSYCEQVISFLFRGFFWWRVADEAWSWYLFLMSSYAFVRHNCGLGVKLMPPSKDKLISDWERGTPLNKMSNLCSKS